MGFHGCKLRVLSIHQKVFDNSQKTEKEEKRHSFIPETLLDVIRAPTKNNQTKRFRQKRSETFSYSLHNLRKHGNATFSQTDDLRGRADRTIWSEFFRILNLLGFDFGNCEFLM